MGGYTHGKRSLHYDGFAILMTDEFCLGALHRKDKKIGTLMFATRAEAVAYLADAPCEEPHKIVRIKLRIDQRDYE